MTILSSIQRSTPSVALSIDEERDLIRAAQAGDSAAALQLISNYAPVMLKAVGREFTNRTVVNVRGNVSVDEIESAAITGFYAAIQHFDPERHDRLSFVIEREVAFAIRSDRLDVYAVNIPPIMHNRYNRALQAADGNPALARRLAPSFGLSSAAFDALSTFSRRVTHAADDQQGHAPSAGASDLDGSQVVGGQTRTTVSIEDLVDTDRALAVLDPTSRILIEALFGIGDQPVMTEREAAAALNIPRTTLQRKRDAALALMRATLGA